MVRNAVQIVFRILHRVFVTDPTAVGHGATD
jgi:hypothetical protein